MADKAPLCVVIAEFAAPPEHRQEFLELCIFDSVRSTTDENGCQQFDVITSEESPDAVILHEVYDDRATFDIHLTTPHFATFAEGLKRLNVTTTVVRILARHYPSA